jgi:TolB-like protein
MANFFAELKRRHMFRVAAAYAVVAWLLLQIVNNVAPVLDLPVWVARAFLLALVIGFPIALLFVWMRDLAPADATAPRAATNKLDYALMGALVLVIALLSYQQLAPAPGVPPQQAERGALSIAVLPFANLSGDESQRFFSDGMSEEISLALAKVPGLTVLARSSSSASQVQALPAREKGRALNARYLIEGSVRKEGERVRIAAQLVEAESGASIWTESYDRQLTSIFATQEDIARAIAGALRVPLGLQQGDSLVRNRTVNLDSYQEYLRAQAMYRNRANDQAMAVLEMFVAREPTFAPGWALLSMAYESFLGLAPALQRGDIEAARRVVSVALPKAEMAAQRAIQLDPGLADGYVALGRIRQRQGQLLSADELFSKALMLDPNNPDALHLDSILLAGVGRVKEALAMRQRLQVLEPFVPLYSNNTAEFLWLNGENESAVAMIKSAPSSAAGTPLLAKIYTSERRYTEAADVLLTIPPGSYDPGVVEEAARLLRTAPTTTSSPESLPRLGFLEFVYIHIGAAERAAEVYQASIDAGYAYVFYGVWHPTYAAVRNTPRFKAYTRQIGLLDYWRAKGWPDLCRPTGADDFECN